MIYIAIVILPALAVVASVTWLVARALRSQRPTAPSAHEAKGEAEERLMLPTHTTDLGRADRDLVFDLEVERIRDRTAGGPG